MYLALRTTSLTVFAIIVSLAPAWAAEFPYLAQEDCSPVRLDRGTAFVDVPRYNMHSLIMCTVPTSAVLFADFNARKNLSSIPPSILFMAVKYRAKLLRENPQEQDELYVDKAFDVLFDMGKTEVCPNTVLPDTSNGKGIDDFVSLLVHGQQSKSPETIRRAIEGYLGPVAMRRVSPESIRLQGSIIRFLDAIVSDICRGQTYLPTQIPTVEAHVAYARGKYPSPASRWSHFQKLINANLRDGVPIGINYCGTVLKDLNVNGITPDGYTSKECKGPQGDTFPHAGVVVGRRAVTWKDEAGSTTRMCQYLVRDTQGESCAGYAADKSATPSDRCDRGQIWVAEDALILNIRDAYVLR